MESRQRNLCEIESKGAEQNQRVATASCFPRVELKSGGRQQPRRSHWRLPCAYGVPSLRTITW